MPDHPTYRLLPTLPQVAPTDLQQNGFHCRRMELRLLLRHRCSSPPPLSSLHSQSHHRSVSVIVFSHPLLRSYFNHRRGVTHRSNLTGITQVVGAQYHEAQAEEVKRSLNTKLYFGNLPYHCDSSQLTSLIGDYASPLMVEVMHDKDTGRSRGFAFVTMNTTQACEAVISNLNGTQYDGRTLKVKFPERWRGRAGMCQESKFKLFVGNLPWSVTSEALRQVFKEYGDLVGARVLYDGDTGRSRGYGFVCYSNKEAMDAAMEALNGMELDGRALRISLAILKQAPSIREDVKRENN